MQMEDEYIIQRSKGFKRFMIIFYLIEIIVLGFIMLSERKVDCLSLICVAFIILFLWVVCLVCRWRIQVTKKVVRFRPTIGHTKEYSIQDLTFKITDDSEVYILSKARGKKICYLNRTMKNSERLLRDLSGEK